MRVNVSKYFVFFVCLYCGHLVFAGTTGKIRGTVVDAESGEPLPGVNVIITKVWQGDEERSFTGDVGAATQINGEYVILKVQPGVYSLTASMMGYTTFTVQRVRVSVDRTSEVDFKLKQTVLDAGEDIVVEAVRDLVQIDVAATENYITAEEYEATPFANRIEDVLALQSGVSGNLIEGTIKIREGDTREVGFMVDGISLIDQKFNRPVMSVQPGVAQEIKIMRNGFNAEYGQSRSGMINVITKNPEPRWHFSIDYQLEPAQKRHYGRDKYDPNWNWWRLYAGPNSFEPDTLYWTDGLYQRYRTWEGWNRYAEKLLNDSNPDNDLTAEEAYELWKWRHRAIPYGDKPGHNIDATLSGPVPLLPWEATFLAGAQYELHPFTFPQSRKYYTQRMGNLKIVNSISADTRLTVNGLYSLVNSVATEASNSIWHREDRMDYDGGGFNNYYPFARPIIDQNTNLLGLKYVQTVSPKLYYEINLSQFYSGYKIKPPGESPVEAGRYFHDRLYLDPQSGFIPRQKGQDDNVSGYQMYGGAYIWEDSYNRRYTLKGFLTSQFHRAHELKAGIDFNYNILKEDRLFLQHGDSTQAFSRNYKVFPIDFGLYVQDKIEFEGMIASVGVRMDYFNVNSERPDLSYVLGYPSDRAIYDDYVNGKYPTKKPEAKIYFSPRIGISHPLTERSKIYFNYGHFVQTPPTFQLYVVTLDGAVPRVFQMGNADLQFEKTVAYELGMDMSLSDFFQLHVGAFYKDNSDVTGTKTFVHTDQSLFVDFYDSHLYSEIRGAEIELRKSAGRFVSGWLNFNYIKKSSANLRIPGLGADPLYTNDPSVGRNGVLWGVPRSNVAQIQPNARGVVTLSAPPDWGPRLLDKSILGDTHLSFRMFFQGGALREHPAFSFRERYPDVRFKEKDRYWTDVRLSRRLRLKSLQCEIYADVSNVLHTEFRYPPGGQSGEDYYYDLWESGRLHDVGTDELSNPDILRTENDDVYWARNKLYVIGLRVIL